ncbi:MAG: DUF5996 family protein [Bacteroidota bacterium]|nr:DUF5996 family protein [Bacteroidota bacterium]
MIHTFHPYCSGPWPSLPYKAWSNTQKTLHMWTQILGKIRLKAMPWQNHSWHTALYISPRGLTTGAMPYGNGLFELELDFVDHRLRMISSFSPDRSFPLASMSVAEFYRRTMDILSDEGIRIEIHPRPNEVEDNIPFARNEHLSYYEAGRVLDFWQACISINNVFQEFRSGFIGKCSPVHFFWGSFDLAITRFSGRRAPKHPGIAPNMPKEVMQEAYSHEVSSAGFWPGSDDFPEPIFYSYCYPTPPDFKDQKILPEGAFWNDTLGEFLLPYDVVRKSEDPEGTLKEFLRSTYIAAAVTGSWDRNELERP